MRLGLVKTDAAVLGSALIGGAIVGAAVLLVEIAFGRHLNAIEHHRDELTTHMEDRREKSAAKANLQLRLGLTDNLQGIDLHGQDLSRSYLRGKDFTSAYLSDADLSISILIGSNFTDALLSGTQLLHVSGQGADFRNAHMNSANMSGSDFSDAIFHGANLSHTDLRDTCLAGCDTRAKTFVGAKLEGAIVTDPSFAKRPGISSIKLETCSEREQRTGNYCSFPELRRLGVTHHHVVNADTSEESWTNRQTKTK